MFETLLYGYSITDRLKATRKWYASFQYCRSSIAQFHAKDSYMHHFISKKFPRVKFGVYLDGMAFDANNKNVL